MNPDIFNSGIGLMQSILSAMFAGLHLLKPEQVLQLRQFLLDSFSEINDYYHRHLD